MLQITAPLSLLGRYRYRLQQVYTSVICIYTMTVDPPAINSGLEKQLFRGSVVEKLGFEAISIPLSASDEANITNQLNMMKKDKVIRFFIDAWKRVVTVNYRQVKS